MTSSLLLLLLALPAAAAATIALFRLDPAWITSAALVASIFTGHWPQIGAPVALDRLLLVCSLFALLLRVPANFRSWPWPRIRGIHLALVAAAGWVLASAVAAGTIGTAKTQFELLDAHGFVPWAYFLIVPIVFRTARQRRILLGWLTAAGAYLGFTAVAEGLNLDPLVYPSYILSSDLLTHMGRARGPFIEAGAMGLALWASVIAASLQAVTTRSRWVRVFSLVVVGLCLVGIVFTLTRAVWIGVAASIVFLGLMPRSRRFVPIGLGAIAVTVVIAIALVPNLGDTLTNRAGDSRSVWDRYNSNAAALRMFEARPLLGFGWDTFGRESQPYYRLSADYPFTPPVNDLHELFLSNLVELGALGALLWLLTLGLGVAGGLSGAKRAPPPRSYFQAAMLAYVVCWAVSANFTPLTYPYPNILVWLFIGLAWPPPEPLGEGRAVVERAPIPQVA